MPPPDGVSVAIESPAFSGTECLNNVSSHLAFGLHASRGSGVIRESLNCIPISQHLGKAQRHPQQPSKDYVMRPVGARFLSFGLAKDQWRTYKDSEQCRKRLLGRKKESSRHFLVPLLLSHSSYNPPTDLADKGEDREYETGRLLRKIFTLTVASDSLPSSPVTTHL